VPKEPLDLKAAKERSLSQDIAELQPLPDVFFGSDEVTVSPDRQEANFIFTTLNSIEALQSYADCYISDEKGFASLPQLLLNLDPKESGF
jgi:hypothetical protein